MALWTSADTAAGAPKFAGVPSNVANTGNTVSASGSQLYGNTTASVFTTGATIGLFGVSANEMQGNGNVSTVTVTNAGTGGMALPAVTIFGANTTQGTATVNAKVVSATVISRGTGYANGEILYVNGGTNTARAQLTVTDIISGNGALLTLSVTTAGKYSTVSAANVVSFLSNSSVTGAGATANVRWGIESVTTNAAGEGYNRSTVTATASDGKALTGTALTVELTGQDGSSSATAGWNLRTVGSGGRAGRESYECLVAMGSMTGDGTDDANFAE